MLRNAILGGRSFEKGFSDSVVLEVGIEEVQCVPANPDVAGDAVFASIIGFLLVSDVFPNILVALDMELSSVCISARS